MVVILLPIDFALPIDEGSGPKILSESQGTDIIDILARPTYFVLVVDPTISEVRVPISVLIANF